LMASTGLMMSGHGIITPVLPLIADNLGATAAQLGMSLSAFAAARLVLNVPLGIVADRYGRRVLLVAGPLVNAVGMVGSGWAASVPELVLWRLIAGAGNAAYLGGAQMYLNDVSTPENRGAPHVVALRQFWSSRIHCFKNGLCAPRQVASSALIMARCYLACLSVPHSVASWLMALVCKRPAS
jgi:MFS family permease